jgi:hypothetical protein
VVVEGQWDLNEPQFERKAELQDRLSDRTKLIYIVGITTGLWAFIAAALVIIF